MPEIAEVALMADSIRALCSGQSSVAIINIEILGGRYASPKHPLVGLDQLLTQLPLTIDSINTKGKFCWLELSNTAEPRAQWWWIGITFGMTGAIYYHPTEQQIGKSVTQAEYMKHFHIKVQLSNQQVFYFADVRRFGRWTISSDRTELDQKLASLGPDMLTAPPISNDQFISRFRRYNSKNICQVLLNQKVISGVGNYLKSEVLYQNKIHPLSQVSSLSDQQLIKLHQAIRATARLAYQYHGASLYTYTGARRERGRFQQMLKVYGKTHDPEGRPVLRLKTPDGRTTYYVEFRPKPKIKVKLKKIKVKIKL